MVKTSQAEYLDPNALNFYDIHGRKDFYFYPGLE